MRGRFGLIGVLDLIGRDRRITIQGSARKASLYGKVC